MRKKNLLVCLAVCLLAVTPCRAEAAELKLQNTTYDAYANACEQVIGEHPEYERLLVKTDGSFDVSDFRAETVVGGPENHFMLFCADAASAKSTLAELTAAEGILYAEQDALESLEPIEESETASLFALNENARHSWGVEHIGADKYEEYLLSLKTPKSLKVALVDSGIKADHSFFKDASIIMGHDYVDGDEDPNDEHGHGTHVAGALVDCMGDLPVDILVLRTMDETGNGYVSRITAAIRAAADAGAKIINLSLGGTHSASNSKEDAVAYAISKGAMVVVASGNHGASIVDFNGCPAHIEGAVVVGAVTRAEEYADYSDYGPTIDFAAPGSGISVPDLQGGFCNASGTSLAAPHVTALAAMLWEMYPSYTAVQIERLLRDSVRDLGTEGKDDYFGYGIPDLRELLGYYRITYAGTGTGLPETQREVRFVKAELSDKRPTRLGYTFMGWNTNPNVSAVLYHPGQQITAAEDFTLFPIWKDPGTILTAFPATYNVNVASAGDAVFYRFAAPKNAVYDFVSTSLDDPKIRILKSDGTEVARDDDSGDGRNFALSAELTGGQVYYIELSMYDDSTGSFSMRVSSRECGTVIMQPKDLSVVSGQVASFQISALGSGLTYCWQKSFDGGQTWQKMAASDGTPKVSFTSKTSMDGMQLRCRIQNSSGKTLYSDAVTLKVAPSFSVIKQPEDQRAGLNKEVYFGVGIEGGAATFQWQKSYDGVTWQKMAASSAKSVTVHFPATKGTDGMKVRCVMTDAAGSRIVSREAVLTVVPKPVFTMQPEDQRAGLGKEVSFSVETDCEAAAFQWQKSYDGVTWQKMAAASAKSDTVHFPASKGTDGMKVRCVITDDVGNRTISREAVLTVAAKPVFTVNPSDVCVTEGSTIALHASAEGDEISYQWQKCFDGVTWYNMAAATAKSDTVTFAATKGTNGMQVRCAAKDRYGNKTIGNPITISLMAKR